METEIVERLKKLPNMEHNIIYEHYYYVMCETKKPVYLDFYDFEDKDLGTIEFYLQQTVRYQKKWFFVKQHRSYFRTEKSRDSAPRMYIKLLYKKAIPIENYLMPIENKATL